MEMVFVLEQSAQDVPHRGKYLWMNLETDFCGRELNNCALVIRRCGCRGGFFPAASFTFSALCIDYIISRYAAIMTRDCHLT